MLPGQSRNSRNPPPFSDMKLGNQRKSHFSGKRERERGVSEDYRWPKRVEGVWELGALSLTTLFYGIMQVRLNFGRN